MEKRLMACVEESIELAWLHQTIDTDDVRWSDHHAPPIALRMETATSTVAASRQEGFEPLQQVFFHKSRTVAFPRSHP